MADLVRCSGSNIVKFARIEWVTNSRHWFKISDIKKIKFTLIDGYLRVGKSATDSDYGTFLYITPGPPVVLDIDEIVATYSINTTTHPYIYIIVGSTFSATNVEIENR